MINSSSLLILFRQIITWVFDFYMWMIEEKKEEKKKKTETKKQQQPKTKTI